MAIKGKKSPFKLEMKTFRDRRDKLTYIVFKVGPKEYHAFCEVQAKKAAKECGSGLSVKEHTQTHWTALWNKE